MKDGIQFITDNHDLIYLSLILAILFAEKFLGETNKVRASNLIDLVTDMLTGQINKNKEIKNDETIRPERPGQQATSSPEANGSPPSQSDS